MTEERWRDALADEETTPTKWAPDRERMRAAVSARLTGAGCEWPDLATIVLRARSHAGMDRATFAARLGLTEDELRALEGG